MTVIGMEYGASHVNLYRFRTKVLPFGEGLLSFKLN